MRILDVGCGNDKLPGAVGIDRSADTLADVVHDLDRLPWPLPESEFDLIRCQDVLEHLDDLVGVMEEIHRVAKPGAEIRIRVPHFSSVQAFTDITHRHFFTTESFHVFVPDQSLYPHYSPVRFAVEAARLVHWKPYRWTGISWLANRFPQRYEKMFAFLFPTQYLEFRLRTLPAERREPQEAEGDGR
ncbi:MAG TPA: class I SAM-dependent methyltransferase [bacterium]|nr:class I SAM-dependent methyltransferase [bacterium]